MRFKAGKFITRITAGLLSVVLLSSTVSSRFVIAADFSTHPELVPEELTNDATQSTDAVNENDADVSNSNSVDLGNGVIISEANPKSDESTTTDTNKENADSDNNDYSIKLQGDTSINLNDTLNVSSDVITAENTDGTDKSYSVDYSVDKDNVITNVTDNNAEFNFTEAGTYTINGTLVVDGNEVSTDTMVVDVKEPQPTEGSHSITFDHYYSVIDESVITTPELLVTTKDASVFSENTNIVSQFDDAYIISCASIQEARYMYSYYVDKVDHISDLSQAFAASDDTEDNTSTNIPNVDALNQLNEAVKSTESVDYSDYIALIDSGADADANFSVIGDDTTDTYGHGTRMLDLIKSENPNAKVLSIKAFNGKTTDAASVYAAIRLAINNNVKIINLSLVAADVDKNAVVKDIIQEAIDKGITVVGAAGNYNLSASRFIPGSIADVITIGACDTDGNKLANSNFDADYYIVANSTSEAAAIYTGLLSNGITESEKLYDKNLRPTKVNDQSINDSENTNVPTEDPYELNNDTDNISNYWLAEAFASALGLKCRSTGNGNYEFYYQPDDFELSTGARTTLIDKNQDANLLAESRNNSYSGTCTFIEGSPGDGTAYFTGDNLFEQVASSNGLDGVYTSCDADWGNSTLSEYATVLKGPTVKYKATVESINNAADGKCWVTYDVLLTNDNFDPRTWRDDTIVVTVKDYYITRKPGYYGSDAWEYVGSHGNEVKFNCGHSGVKRSDGTTLSNPTTWEYSTTLPHTPANKADYDSMVSTIQTNYIKKMNNYTINAGTPAPYKGIRYTADAGDYLTLTGTSTGPDTGNGVTHTYTYSMPIQRCDQTQIYRGKVTAWKWRYVYVNVQKNIDQDYMDLYNTGNYPINTNTITLYDGNDVVYDAITKQPCTFTPNSDGDSKTFALDYNAYHDRVITAKETVGSSFEAVHVSISSTHAQSTIENSPDKVTVINTLINDPVPFKIYKVSDKTGKQGQYNASVAPADARFRIDYFTDANRTNLYRSWTVKSDDNGLVDLRSANNVVSGNYFKNPTNNEEVTLPVGYYTITEVQSPKSNAFSHTGMYTNGQPYYLSVLPDNDHHYVATMEDAANQPIFTQRETGTTWYDYTGSIGKLVNPTVAGVYQIEDESWRPLGILKTDSDLNDLRHGDDSLKIPQGSAAYAGAVYQLFSKTNKDAASMFDASYNNPNGNGKLSFGTNNTITATNGDGNKFFYTANGAKPVLFNNQPVYVTLNQYGYGQTNNISVPYDNDYVFYEVTAPSGYYVNTTPNNVSTNDWLTDSNGHAVNVKMTDFNGVEHDVVKITESSYRDGSTLDDVIRYGFALYKKDSTSSVDTLNNAQGDGSLNNIRFAVINRSANRIILRDKYNTVDTGYSAIKNNTVIEPNQICAILTTHTHNGQEGYISMYGLPYGKYEIVELKRDAGSNEALIGAYYNSQGNSTYANNSYLWQNNDFHIDYTSDADKAHSGVNGISHFTWSYANNNADHIAQNKEFIDGFQGYKMDEDYLAVTEGDSDTNNIKYAVINRSNRSMEILASDLEKLGTVDPNYSDYISYTPSTQINPGSVVAVLTTHKGPNNSTAVSNGEITEGTHKNESADGYFSLYGLPYGRYEVVELRRDANVNPGDVWANTNKGTSIYANDSMYWKSYSYTYTLTDTADEGAHNDVRTALAKHNSPYANNSTNQYQNQAFRDGFSFWKRDLTYNKVSDHPQGDASFNDIRYAVVNVSDDNVKMFNKYTNMMPAVDRPNVEILDNVAIAPGQVCAIVTSHNQSGNELDNGNLQGYVALFGLPYGRYEIHELRADATIGVGDVYEGSDKLGTSIYANHLDNSSSVSNTNGSRSMLWNDTLFYYDLRDTGDGVHTLVNDVNNLHANDTANDDDVWENEVVHGSIKIKKYDFETGLSDATQQQGENSLKGIAYAIVNRSKWSISYPYETTTGEDRHFEPGEVVDVLETDENGEIYIPYIPYGTYDIYELRIPQSRNKDTLTKGHQVTQHMVFDESAWKNGTNPDVYGNDERSNEYYSWNDNISHVSVINETSHEINPGYYVNPEKGRTIRTNEFENLNEYSNLPVRSDLFTIKVDIDGKRMGYIPWLISLVESDEDGKPILNDDGTYKVIEEHIAVTDDRGEINTRDWTKRPKTLDNVNQLDGLYNGVDFTGTKEQLKAAAGQNIWFGTYNGLNNQRGSLLEGTYIMQELRRSSTYGYALDDEESYYDANHVLRRIHWNTEMYDMLSSRVIVTHDNMVYDPVDFDIPVNIPIYAKSDALDLATRSNSTTPSTQAHLRDTVHFGNLNGTQKYGYITDIWRVEKDGTKHLLKESDMTILDFTGDAVEDTDGKLCSVIKNADNTNTIIRNGYTLKYDNGNFTAIKKPTNEDPVFNVLHDFDIVQDFEVDSSSCEEGERIAFSVNLYKSVGATGWSLVKSHNTNLDEPTQDVEVIAFNTYSTNKTTGTRIGSLAEYAYDDGNANVPLVNKPSKDYNSTVNNRDNGIVGYTIADDTLNYSGLTEDRSYAILVSLVDDSGKCITDIYGNECTGKYINLYIDNSLSEVIHSTSLKATAGTGFDQVALAGPSQGSIKLSDFGVGDFVIPNGVNAHFQADLLRGANNADIKRHNADRTEESEAIRWMNIDTTAMSEEGIPGIITNGKHFDYVNGEYSVLDQDAILRDKIHYSNLAESAKVRVEGYVYLVKQDENGNNVIDFDNGTDYEYVAHESKVFDLTDVPEGNIEMQYTIKNSGQYSERQLVVCERVFMDVAGKCEQHPYSTGDIDYNNYSGNNIGTKSVNRYDMTTEESPREVLIAVHEDLNDKMQTVSVPYIKNTQLNNTSYDISYKNVSRDIANVKLTDKVTYNGLKTGTAWTLTAAVMTTDADNKIVPVVDAEGNNVVITKDFTPSKSSGEVDVPIEFTQEIRNLDWSDTRAWTCYETLALKSTSTDYATHNNILDKDQTVYIPTLKTKVSTIYDGHNQSILPQTEQEVTDHVYIKNFGITPNVHEKYTLKMEAYNATTGEPILNADGQPYVSTKTYDVMSDGKDLYIDGEKSDAKLIVGKTTVADPTGNYGTNLPKYNTNLFGDDKKPINLDIDLTMDATNYVNENIAFHETLYYGEDATEGFELMTENSNDNADQIVYVANDPKIVDTYLADSKFISTDDKHTTLGHDVELTDQIHCEDLLQNVWYEMRGRLVFADTNEPVLDSEGNPITGTVRFESDDNGIGDAAMSFKHLDTIVLDGKSVVAFQDCYYIGTNSEGTPIDRVIAKHGSLDNVRETVNIPKLSTQVSYEDVKSTPDESAEDKTDWTNAKLVTFDGTKTDKVTFTDTVSYNNLTPGKEYKAVGRLYYRPSGLASSDKKTSLNKDIVDDNDNTTPITGEDIVNEDIPEEDDSNIVSDLIDSINDSINDSNNDATTDDTNAETDTNTEADTNMNNDDKESKEDTTSSENTESDNKYKNLQVLDDGKQITSTTKFVPTESSGEVDVEFSIDASKYAGSVIVVFEDIYQYNEDTEKYDTLVARHCDLDDAHQGFTTTLLLHINLAKSDFSDKKYYLKNAEITIYEDKDCTTILKDVNGNDCISTTNQDGAVEFTIATNDEFKEYYAKETKAPFGYKLYKGVMKVTPTKTRESDGICPINMKMLDKIIIIASKRPLKTGDNSPIILVLLMLVICVSSALATLLILIANKKPNTQNAENITNTTNIQ